MEARISSTEGIILEKSHLSLDIERLRKRGTDKLLLGALVIWMLYSVSIFRNPLQPIMISDGDANAAARQILFSMTGMLAMMRLFFSRTLGPVLIMRTPMVALAGLLIFSATWSGLPFLTLKRALIFLFGLLALIVIVHSTRRPAQLMLRTVVSFTTVVAAVSLILHVVLPEACTVNPERPGLAGIAIHPNTLAPVISVGLLLSLGFKKLNGRSQLLLLIARGVLTIALIMTFSMTTWLTTLVGLLIYSFLQTSTYRKGVLQVAIIGVLMGINLIGIDTIRASFFDAAGKDESLSGRDELWAQVWNECKESPLIGTGYGAFWTEGKGRELVQTWNPRQSHNAYLDLMLDIGGIGFLAVLIIFPARLYFHWRFVSGESGSDRRRAASAMMTVAFSYMLIYSMGQSFFLRFDVYPFFIVTWITLIIINPDSNNLSTEFSESSVA